MICYWCGSEVVLLIRYLRYFRKYACLPIKYCGQQVIRAHVAFPERLHHLVGRLSMVCTPLHSGPILTVVASTMLRTAFSPTSAWRVGQTRPFYVRASKLLLVPIFLSARRKDDYLPFRCQ